jgi:hypothetical protein
MKRIYKLIICLCVSGLFVASCDDFLDRPPYDQFTSEDYWKTDAQVRTYVYGFYSTVFPGYGTGTTTPALLESGGDDQVASIVQAEYSPTVVPASSDAWTFTNVRKANELIENVTASNLTDEEKAHWIGIGRFFRAYFYSNLVFTFGDVPYFDRVPQQSNKKEDLDYLYKPRDPRLEVVQHILDDFQFALDNVRTNDGALQVNKYVAAAMASRLMLREGTVLKYHNIDRPMAEKCLAFSKKASEFVMSGPFAISGSYKGLFVSDDLAGNSEVIIYRKYLDGILAHNLLTASYSLAQGGLSKSFAETFRKKDGFPIYFENEYWTAPTVTDFFADRDPRLTDNIRPKYCIQGEANTPFAYSLSGYSWCKYMDDTKAGSTDPLLNSGRNITDAPCLRLGEVLLNYVEAAYELNQLNASEYSFTQDDLDKSINLLRDRKGVEMPHLEMVGNQPAIKGVVYDDPNRLRLNPDNDVSSLLWEIRTERRVELAFEGLRPNDLKRWKKLDYTYYAANPDIRYGAYIRLADYPNRNESVILEDPTATEGYILRNSGANTRKPAVARNYISPVGLNQIQLYKDNGYTLAQTKEWQ